MTSLPERRTLLQATGLFGALGDAELDALAARTLTRPAPEGTLIIREGDLADRFYLILEGSAAVYETGGDASPRLLVRLREGQGFGELGLLSGAPRAATVIAEPGTRVLAVDGERFMALHAEIPALRDYVQTLHNVYLLPGRSFTTQHAGRFMRLVLDGTRLEDWRQLVFRSTGGLRLEQRAELFEEAEVVCACMGSTRGQLLRYAGYRQGDGTVLGDPANAELTERGLALGWPGGPRTAFDLLPIVIEIPGREPRWFALPHDAALEVPIVHPRHAWFADLGLRWHALPAVSEMLFDAGGVRYSAAPFNGWYAGTEIGVRNFGDKHRYDLAPEVARRLGLDTSSERTLWRDRALVEMNVAVLHSFQRMGVKMTDHHAASDDFMHFTRTEETAGRPVYGNWSWLVPPTSGSATDVFHGEWEERILKPN